PMHYLARWRIQLAAHQLRNSDTPLVRIAEEVGYESEAAFNRAFKRHFGLPPAAWRKKASASRQTTSPSPALSHQSCWLCSGAPEVRARLFMGDLEYFFRHRRPVSIILSPNVGKDLVHLRLHPLKSLWRHWIRFLERRGNDRSSGFFDRPSNFRGR